ncbi:MAG: hypothetical protein ACLRMJ_02190 [Alistipes finegoldii]
MALLLASSASAQRHMRDGRNGEYSPTVYLISVHEVDTVYNCGGCGSVSGAQPAGDGQRHAGLYRDAPPRLPAVREASSYSRRRTTGSPSRWAAS